MQSLKVFLSKRGAVAELARALNVTPSAVSQWLGTRVPAERVVDVERITGVPRERLRPDLYRIAPAQDAVQTTLAKEEAA